MPADQWRSAVPEDGSVRLVEMLPRDGLQSLSSFVPTEEKIELVERLAATGVDEVEMTAFAHPDAVPNLRDAEDVAAGVERRDDVTYRALVPNAVGMERALDAGVDKVNALVAVSEAYCRKNQNAEREAVLADVAEIVDLAAGTPVEVEAGVATSFYCPYEGRVPLSETRSVVDAVVSAGVDEVTLAATMGLADPGEVGAAIAAVREDHPDLDLGLHLHDTNGMALASVCVALANGVDRFDASVCGVGGGVVLPDALEGVGNVPTEDLLHMASRLGLASDEQFAAVADLAKEVAADYDVGANSHVVRGGTVENVLAEMGGSD